MASMLESILGKIADALGLTGGRSRSAGDGTRARPSAPQTSAAPSDGASHAPSRAQSGEGGASGDGGSAPARGGEFDPVPAGLEAARVRPSGSGGRSDKAGVSDPLAEKHKAPIDENFRTVDYRNLSEDERARDADADRATHRHAAPGQASPAGEREVLPQFADFGGSVVSADVIREGEDRGAPNRPSPSAADGLMAPGGAAPGNAAGPARPDPLPLGAPNPDGPTPSGPDRGRAGSDPLADKHKARFDNDFRTVDYAALSERRGAGAPDRPRPEQRGARRPPREDSGGAGYAPGFKSFGSLGSVAGEMAPSEAAPTPVDDGADDGADPATPAEPVEPATGTHAPRRLSKPEGDKPDDLTRIRGIGPTLERRLFENGIYHLSQIAAWSDDEARWVDETIGFAGRVERESWVAQARGLVEGGSTER